MRHFVIAFLLVQMFSKISLAAPEVPSSIHKYIISNLSHYNLVNYELDPELKSYFKSKGMSTSPLFVFDDFNGDGQNDWIGLLENRDRTLDIVAIYSDSNQYKHTVLIKNKMKTDKYLPIGVFKEKPGIVHSFPFDNVPEEELTAKLSFPGAHVYFFEISSVVIYWKNGKFQKIWTSD